MKNLLRVLCFIIVFLVIFVNLDNAFYDHSSGWEATDDWSRQQFDVVFMGNSHVYCNINPVIVNDALNINSIDLASSNQPSEITYFYLKELLKKTTPRALVIEANILNSSVDYLYDTDKQGVLYQSIDGVRNPFARAQMVYSLIPVDKWFEAYSSLFRPIETWTRYERLGSSENYDSLLGYKIKDNILDSPIDLKRTEQEYKSAAGKQTGSLDSLNMTWFKRILDLAQRRNIPVYIIKSPISYFSPENSDMMLKVSELAQSYSVVLKVHDYNLDLVEMGLTQEDFFDSGHLNYLGASKFTEYLVYDLGNWLEIEPNFSSVGWLKGMQQEPLNDGKSRYTIDLYDGCLIRFITNSDNSGQGSVFSRNNTIILPNDVPLLYEIKAEKSCSYTYDHPQTFCITPLRKFRIEDIDITQNDCTLTVKNNFAGASVQYAWYVYKDGEVILKDMYKDNNVFSFNFKDVGNYRIKAYIRTMDRTDSKSLYVANVTVNNDGVTWEKP